MGITYTLISFLTNFFIQEKEVRRDWHLQPLHPTFELIGSVVEGTRLGSANELDVTVAFPSLFRGDHGPLRLGRREDGSLDAMAATADPKSPLAAFSAQNGKSAADLHAGGRMVFDYPRFLHHLLKAIKVGLMGAMESQEWPTDLEFQVYNPLKCCYPENVHYLATCVVCSLLAQKTWDSSNVCCSAYSDFQRSSVFHPFTHCSDCRPPVAHTKLGPVLMARNHGDSGKVVTVTMDVVPVFPLESEGLGLLDLFNEISKTLGASTDENGRG